MRNRVVGTLLSNVRSKVKGTFVSTEVNVSKQEID